MNENTPDIIASNTILLVMDYQIGILNNIPNSGELLPRMANAIQIARSKGVHIGYVRVAFDDTEYNAIPETNKAFNMMTTGRKMHKDMPETAIHNEIIPEPGDIMVRKIRFGAFSTTDLDQQLRDLKIDTLILAGISTSGVVLSTVRDAADRDYRIYVLEDCCSDRDSEVHDILMQKVFPRQTYIISITDMSDLLGEK